MSSKVFTIAVTGTRTDADNQATWLYYAPKQVTVKGHTFHLVHGGGSSTDPFSEKGYHCDCDFAIVNDGPDTIPTEIQTLMGDRCVKVARPYKFEYMTKLWLSTRPYSKHKIEVMLPIDWSGADNTYHGCKANIPSRVTHVILKSMGGARGENQCIVPIDELEAFTGGVEYIPVNRLEEFFPNVKFFYSSSHKDTEGHWIDGVMGFFQEAWLALPYIKGVIEEFRIIRGGDKYVAYIRKRDKINGEDRVVTSSTVPLDSANYPDYFGDMEKLRLVYGVDFKDIIECLDKMGFYTGSVDFYITKDKEGYHIGIFECCSQYGTTYMPLATRKELALGFVEFCAEHFLTALEK